MRVRLKRKDTAPPHVYLNHYAGEGGQWFHHRHGTKYISEYVHKAKIKEASDLWFAEMVARRKAENDLSAFRQAVEEYFDATAVMDIERRAADLSRIPPHKRSPMEHERDE